MNHRAGTSRMSGAASLLGDARWQYWAVNHILPELRASLTPRYAEQLPEYELPSTSTSSSTPAHHPSFVLGLNNELHP